MLTWTWSLHMEDDRISEDAPYGKTCSIRQGVQTCLELHFYRGKWQQTICLCRKTVASNNTFHTKMYPSTLLIVVLVSIRATWHGLSLSTLCRIVSVSFYETPQLQKWPPLPSPPLPPQLYISIPEHWKRAPARKSCFSRNGGRIFRSRHLLLLLYNCGAVFTSEIFNVPQQRFRL